ncbi:MAG: DUF5615 family PIN-like protein [Anaerolineae bacterium]|nr:DUF5615 family PIN-like protein [Anaerolineae bacterium]
MRQVLFDEDVPRRLRQELPGLEIVTVPEVGGSGLKNGELLRRAEGRFDVFVTADRNLRFQQNLSAFALGVVVLEGGSIKLEDLRRLASEPRHAVETVQPRQVVLVPPA